MDFKVSVFKYAKDTSAMGPQVWGNASFPTLLQLAPQLENTMYKEKEHKCSS